MKITLIIDTKEFTVYENVNKNIIYNINSLKGNEEVINNFVKWYMESDKDYFEIKLELSDRLLVEKISISNIMITNNKQFVHNLINDYVLNMIEQLTTYRFDYDLENDSFLNIVPEHNGDFKKEVAFNKNEIEARGYKMIAFHVEDKNYFI